MTIHMNYERFPLILMEILNDYSSLNTYSIFKERLINRNVSTHDSKQLSLRMFRSKLRYLSCKILEFLDHIIWVILYGRYYMAHNVWSVLYGLFTQISDITVI